jgi:hypothetical protein
MKRLDKDMRRIRNLLGCMFFSSSLLKPRDLVHCLSLLYLGGLVDIAKVEAFSTAFTRFLFDFY